MSYDLGYEFIPNTLERQITRNIVFRPIKSWHSNTYAGEGLYILPGTNGDSSGCLVDNGGYPLAHKPLSVTHRLYWHKKNEYLKVSAFLSYPNAMGVSRDYFWEVDFDDCRRFYGTDAEADMEKAIIRYLNRNAKVVV